MTITKWVIENLQLIPQQETYSNVVISANWRCIATQTIKSDYPEKQITTSVYGNCIFPSPKESFTPYSDLTKEQVLNWCYQNGVNKSEIENTVSAELESQINPKTIELPLPWENE